MKKVSNPEIEALTKEQLKALKDAAIVAAHEKRVKKAELMLQNIKYATIIKWETKLWGEIPADFGLKS